MKHFWKASLLCLPIHQLFTFQLDFQFIILYLQPVIPIIIHLAVTTLMPLKDFALQLLHAMCEHCET
jgi:hypothetical protein